MQKFAILTRTCRPTVAGLLFFFFVVNRAGVRRVLQLAKNVDKTARLIIHIIMNFDHAWVEHIFARAQDDHFQNGSLQCQIVANGH